MTRVRKTLSKGNAHPCIQEVCHMPMRLQADSRTQPSIDAEHQAIPLVDIGVFGIWVVEVGPKLLAEQEFPQQELVSACKAYLQWKYAVESSYQSQAGPAKCR